MEQTAESIFMDPYWIWPIVLCSVVFFLAIFIGVLWYLSTQTNHDVGSPVEKTSLLVVRDKPSFCLLKCFQSPAEQMLISSPDDSSGRSNYSPLVRIVELDTILQFNFSLTTSTRKLRTSRMLMSRSLQVNILINKLPSIQLFTNNDWHLLPVCTFHKRAAKTIYRQKLLASLSRESQFVPTRPLDKRSVESHFSLSKKLRFANDPLFHLHLN